MNLKQINELVKDGIVDEIICNNCQTRKFKSPYIPLSYIDKFLIVVRNQIISIMHNILCILFVFNHLNICTKTNK